MAKQMTDKELKRILWLSTISATLDCEVVDGKLPCERGDYSCLVYGEKPCNADFVQDMYREMLDHRND